LTSECQSVVIRVGFHERLDIYKRQYDGLDGMYATQFFNTKENAN
jgi:hypothetical protein